MITTKTTEQIHGMYEINNYGEPNIKDVRWVKVEDILKMWIEIKELNDNIGIRGQLFGISNRDILNLDKILSKYYDELSQSNDEVKQK